MSDQVRAACVIGYPVAHSRSPTIHNFWIGKYGLAAEYRREEVEPETFHSFVSELDLRGYVGANITLPHKEAALAASEPDERAQAVGAANTLWLDDGVLRSTNTDVEGFLANLDDAAPGWGRGLDEAIVLGSGGSARAIVYGLREHGCQRIYVVNRTVERAEALRERFGNLVRPTPWEDLPALLSRARLLVNTTSLGMAGQPALEVDLSSLPSDATVADLVYSPLETPLLAAARARELRTADGLGMLLHQAVRGFSLWFGVTPAVTPDLRALVEADLLPKEPKE